MKRVSSRIERLEKRVAQRPACLCQDMSGPFKFVVLPPRVIGEPYEEPPPRPPERCSRCGREIKHLHFVVKPPREIGAGAAS